MPSKRIFLVLSLLALTALVMGSFFLFDWPSVLDSSSRPETGWEERRHRYAVDRSTYTSQRGGRRNAMDFLSTLMWSMSRSRMRRWKMASWCLG